MSRKRKVEDVSSNSNKEKLDETKGHETVTSEPESLVDTQKSGASKDAPDAPSKPSIILPWQVSIVSYSQGTDLPDLFTAFKCKYIWHWTLYKEYPFDCSSSFDCSRSGLSFLKLIDNDFKLSKVTREHLQQLIQAQETVLSYAPYFESKDVIPRVWEAAKVLLTSHCLEEWDKYWLPDKKHDNTTIPKCCCTKQALIDSNLTEVLGFILRSHLCQGPTMSVITRLFARAYGLEGIQWWLFVCLCFKGAPGFIYTSRDHLLECLATPFVHALDVVAYNDKIISPEVFKSKFDKSCAAPKLWEKFNKEFFSL